MLDQNDQLISFLNTVCGKVKWKRAHGLIRQELSEFYLDALDAHLEMGEDETQAAEHVMREMGDSSALGEKLNRMHQPKPMGFFFFSMASLVLTGSILRLYISHQLGEQLPWLENLISVVACWAVLLWGYSLDPRKILRININKINIGVNIAVLILYLLRWFTPISKFESSLSIMLLPLYFTLCDLYMDFDVRFAILSIVLAFAHAFLPIQIVGRFHYMAVVISITCILSSLLAHSRGRFKDRKKWEVGLLLIGPPAWLLSAFHVIAKKADLWTLSQADTVVRDVIAHSPVVGSSEQCFYILDGSTVKFDYTLTFLITRFGRIVIIVAVMFYAATILFALYHCLKQRTLIGVLISFTMVFSLTVELLAFILKNLGLTILPASSLLFITQGGGSLLSDSFIMAILLSILRSGDLIRDSRFIAEERSPWKR